MGAAGVSGAAGTWMQREPFEEWLADPGRPDGISRPERSWCGATPQALSSTQP
jgi:LPS sulfotransferase NodH